MTETLIIPHGGSGKGVTYWGRYGEGCLIAADLHEQLITPCQRVEGYLRYGTLFHLLATLGRKLERDEVEIIDEECGEWEPSVIEEGWRLHENYWKKLDGEPEFGDGKVIARELSVSGPDLDALVGESDCAGTLDAIVERPDGGIWIYDYKTSSQAVNRYTKGTALLQRWLYSLCAQSLGHEVEKFVFRQIVKTKSLKIIDYTMLPPTPAEIKILRNYLQYAKRQKEHGIRGPHLSACAYCIFKENPCFEGI